MITAKPTEDTMPAPPPAFDIQKQNRSLLMILLAAIPITIAALNYQSIIGMAASVRCKNIQRVAINPGEITTTTASLPIEMSTLAYDINNQPITKGVVYDWGISSINSIGTVKSRQDLATFYPSRQGEGDLYVRAKNACTKEKITGSVKVTVHAVAATSPTPRRNNR